MRFLAALTASVALAHAGELHQEARVCDADRMRQLLAKNPSLNEPDENGLTALHIAVDARQKTCVALLIEAGAHRTLSDRQGRSPLDAALAIREAKGRSEILRLFWDPRQQPAAPDPGGSKLTSLEYWAMRRQAEIVKLLLKLGADPNQPGSTGSVPLADAALKGDVEAVRALLAKGARTNVISPAGMQPIHEAALGDNAEVLRELVAAGADKNARSRDESITPLHIAASMGKVKAVEALISLGADRTLKDARGRTPLETADRAGNSDIVALLKQK